MNYRRMTLVERMDIFRLLYVPQLKKAAIGTVQKCPASSVARETGKGMDYRQGQREQWRPPEAAAKRPAAEYPEHTMSGKTIYTVNEVDAPSFST